MGKLVLKHRWGCGETWKVGKSASRSRDCVSCPSGSIVAWLRRELQGIGEGEEREIRVQLQVHRDGVGGAVKKRRIEL